MLYRALLSQEGNVLNDMTVSFSLYYKNLGDDKYVLFSTRLYKLAQNSLESIYLGKPSQIKTLKIINLDTMLS